MNESKEIKVITRRTAREGKFQTTLELSGVMNVEQFAYWLADRSSYKPVVFKQMIMEIEEGILSALGQGCQVNLGLASFYPRLSGTLSARDIDPSAEGLFIRGAVKARRPLMNGLKKKLTPVNSLSPCRISVLGVTDMDENKAGVVTAGHKMLAVGYGFPIVAGRADEGVWLEKRKKHGTEKVAKARVLASTNSDAQFVFDKTPPSGKYFLVIGTRCGKGKDFKVVRGRCEVRVK